MVRPKISYPVANQEETIGVRRYGNGRFECAVAETQGQRLTHEDVVEVHCRGGVGDFWVLDGHRGSAAAEFAGPALSQDVGHAIRGSKLPSDGHIQQGFRSIDNRLRKHLKQLDEGQKAGCTVVGLLAAEQKDGTYDAKLVNCGDSRGVIIRDVDCEDIGNNFRPAVLLETADHKPGAAHERARIQAAGGTVRGGKYLRIDGNLAVSRGLGDFEFKADKKLHASEQKVSCIPDTFEVVGLKPGTLVILACDGLWDVMTSEAAANFIRMQLQEFPTTDLGELAGALVHIALKLGSDDNITVLIARLADGSAWAAGDNMNIPTKQLVHYFEAYEQARKLRRRLARKDSNSKSPPSSESGQSGMKKEGVTVSSREP